MTREFIVEVKGLDGEQKSLLMREVEGYPLPARVTEDGEVHHDIMMLNPAAHDLIDIINASTKGAVIITSEEHPMVTGAGEIAIQSNVNEKIIPVGPIQFTTIPMIDVAVIMYGTAGNVNGRIALKDITCLGQVNFIDSINQK